MLHLTVNLTVMTSLPTYHLGEGGHDTFPVWIACEKATIKLFCLIGQETIELLKPRSNWLQKCKWYFSKVTLTSNHIMATKKDLNRNDVWDLFTAAVASTKDFFSIIFKGRAERMHPKNGFSERRHCSCTSYGIYSREHCRKMHRSSSTDSKMFVDVVSPL